MVDKFRIAIISGKLGDVDGVSLEVDKWIDIFKKLGHEIFTIAGTYGTKLKSIPEENQWSLEKLRFGSSEQRYYEKLVFPFMSKYPPHLSKRRVKEIVSQIEAEGKDVADRIFDYIQEKNIDVIIGENTNAMPMSILGGMAVYILAKRYRVATIFHHHDFWWERSRFSGSYIEGLLSRIMPPNDPGLEHIVISSYAAHILASIKRVVPFVVPNCEDFTNIVSLDSYNNDLRKELGFKEDDILIIQPTRIVRRKRIEDSVELIGKFIDKYPEYKSKVKFIISLYQGDEPDENYIDLIKEKTEERGFPLHMIADRVASERGKNSKGEKLYTNRDVLVNADLVTYLPIWEGFGNALLEAVAARIPVVTTEYLVYKTDIKIMEFNNIEIRDVYDDLGKLIIPQRALDEMKRVLTDLEYRKKMVERNFRIGKKEFGFKTLEDKLGKVLDDYSDEIKASRKRIVKSKTSYSV